MECDQLPLRCCVHSVKICYTASSQGGRVSPFSCSSWCLFIQKRLKGVSQYINKGDAMEHKQFRQLQTKMETIDVEGRLVRAIVSTGDLDDGNDIIMPGAFDRSLKTPSIRKRIKMLWQHKVDVVIGKPMTLEPLPDGSLLTETYISKIQKGEDYLIQAKEGIVDEFSIGFADTQGSRNQEGNRLIEDLTLYEYSAVTWGMNKNTVLMGIKSIASARPREIEEALRDVGFSIKEAKAIMSGGLKSLRDVGISEKSNEFSAIMTELKNINQIIKGE